MTNLEIYKKAEKAGLENAKNVEPLGNGYVYIKLHKSDFSKWALKEGLAEKDIERGTVIVVPSQDSYGSLLKEEAFAEAFSKVLTENNIINRAGSYLT